MNEGPYVHAWCVLVVFRVVAFSEGVPGSGRYDAFYLRHAWDRRTAQSGASLETKRKEAWEIDTLPLGLYG